MGAQLSILFMRFILNEFWATETGFTFNSLYEILKRKIEVSESDIILSILFMRFLAHPQVSPLFQLFQFSLWDSDCHCQIYDKRNINLSILFMRFFERTSECFYSLNTFQFSLWDSMRLIYDSCRSFLLSILFMRFFNRDFWLLIN